LRPISQPRRSLLPILATRDGAQEEAETLRVLFLAAHPDDETLGASALLGRLKDRMVAFLTDGAPHDSRFWPPHISSSRDTYACLRAEEAASALACAGIPRQRITFLGGVDQEAIHELPALLKFFLEVVSEFQPAAIITHPYEGGHPDHDTAALVANLTTRTSEQQGQRLPEILEMTSYHARNGSRVTGYFLPHATAGGEARTIDLTPEERACKARMLGCYVSQRQVISDFPLEPERVRVAPAYDFTAPPHEGSLWYETLGWPLTGAMWREIVARTLPQVSEVTCR